MYLLFTADFETTTKEDDCRVWAWGVCEIGNTDHFVHGNSIDTFFEYIISQGNNTYYFHNLKFDGEFIMVWLFEHGFKHVVKREDEKAKTFTTLISDKGQFYSIKIIFEKKGKKTKYVKILDSLKILPFSVAQIAKAFGLPISKLEIDYNAERCVGYELTPEEICYLKNDVEIVARALKVLFDQDLQKMTQGSNALYDFKQTIGEKQFDHWFPQIECDKDIRQSYRGGFTYLNPTFKNKDIETTLVLDVNSLYPWVLRDCPLPYGEPIFFRGEYEYDALYPLYVQMLTCQFDVKKDRIPTIQLKNNLSFIPTEYVTSSGDEEVTLCLTSVDLELFKEHYDIYNPVYHSGWKFKSATGLFAPYIDKWGKVKIDSTISGNKGMRTLAKLMMNALYGKFGTNPKVQSKIPFYDTGLVRYSMGEEENRPPVYIPVACFVTSWARRKTITSAQALYKYFVYADTDSCHLSVSVPDEMLSLSQKDLENLTTADLKKYGVNLPDDFVVDPVALGAWKVEEVCRRARYIRQKTYIHDFNPPETWAGDRYDKSLLSITCAGMPTACYEFVTWDNFREGATYAGKLVPKHVKGGIILKETEYTIQKST